MKPTLKSQSLMLASGSLKRRDYDDDDVFAMDIDDDMNYYGRGGPSDDDCMGDDTDALAAALTSTNTSRMRARASPNVLLCDPMPFPPPESDFPRSSVGAGVPRSRASSY